MGFRVDVGDCCWGMAFIFEKLYLLWIIVRPCGDSSGWKSLVVSLLPRVVVPSIPCLMVKEAGSNVCSYTNCSLHRTARTLISVTVFY